MPKTKKATPKSDFFTNIIILARVNTIKFNSYSLFCTQFEIVKFRKGDDDKDLSVNGYTPYFRILIKKLS